MKKSHSLIALSVALLGFGCTSNTEQHTGHLPDSIVADSMKSSPSNEVDGSGTDSPALGTDNIRLDSMNNSSR